MKERQRLQPPPAYVWVGEVGKQCLKLVNASAKDQYKTARYVSRDFSWEVDWKWQGAKVVAVMPDSNVDGVELIPATKEDYNKAA